MTTWIISADPHIEALIAEARALPGEVVLIDAGCGPRAGVDRIISLPIGDGPVEAEAPAAVAAIQAASGDVVLVRNAPAERVLAGAVAAALDASVLTDVRELSADSATVGKLGGITVQRVNTGQVRVVLADGGAEAPAGGQCEAGPAAQRRGMTITASHRDEGGVVDLTSSKRIVSVGMGFHEQADLALAQQLATAIGADLACSRPVAEGRGWMSRESYVGVTGLRVSPEVYVALGISGQLQHMAGIRGAQTIVAVNSDAAAPIFAACDYGVVGDIYQVLPALADQLQSH